MDKNQLQQLRELPIEGVAGRLGLHVERHKSLCPFHDDRHPSLSFNVARNTFRCFVCGASGGTIDLVMRHLGKDFKEACRWLADEHNIIHHEYRPPAATQPPPFDAARYSRLFSSPCLGKALVRAHQAEEREAHPGAEGREDIDQFFHTHSSSPKYQPDTPLCLTKYPREVSSTTETRSPAFSGRT